MEYFRSNPCRSCCRAECDDAQCARWQLWFLESWAAVNGYAWKIADEHGAEEPKAWRYEAPHMVKSPCAHCLCEKWCDTPCRARLAWWDARMENLRRRAGFDRSGKVC